MMSEFCRDVQYGIGIDWIWLQLEAAIITMCLHLFPVTGCPPRPAATAGGPSPAEHATWKAAISLALPFRLSPKIAIVKDKGLKS